MEEVSLLHVEPKVQEDLVNNVADTEDEQLPSYVDKDDKEDKDVKEAICKKEVEEEEDPFMLAVEKICFLVYWPL